MKTNIMLLDCTLRDGAYVNDGKFGVPCIKGIIKQGVKANIDIIECGWLKNDAYKKGSTYFHVPSDVIPFLGVKDAGKLYVAMIDWDRYDVSCLPEFDGKSLDAIRVVFPHGKCTEALKVAEEIKKKGYKVLLQAANTLAYNEEDLIALAKAVNELLPSSLSVVDTFGAMYSDDLDRIIGILDGELDSRIALGFHSHNNMQLSFALCIHFVSALYGKRDVVVDASLCGMGRGAGNATTELVANFLNQRYHKNYDMNQIMDAIDMYMAGFIEKYKWGYSTPYFIAGMYQCHVNNIAYLQRNHRTNSRDMRNIIDSLSVEERRKYDYDLLEAKYLENQGRNVPDEKEMEYLKQALGDRTVLLIGPGKTTVTEQERIHAYIARTNPIVIFVNALNPLYEGEFLFLINSTRYEYAKNAYKEQFASVKRIILSNIKTVSNENEIVVNFNSVIKRGWEHFDNAIITCLRLMNRLSVKNVGIAGFDGFTQNYNESYADESLPTLSPENIADELNAEIQDIFDDFCNTVRSEMKMEFVTTCMFEK